METSLELKPKYRSLIAKMAEQLQETPEECVMNAVHFRAVHLRTVVPVLAKFQKAAESPKKGSSNYDPERQAAAFEFVKNNVAKIAVPGRSGPGTRWIDFRRLQQEASDQRSNRYLFSTMELSRALVRYGAEKKRSALLPDGWGRGWLLPETPAGE